MKKIILTSLIIIMVLGAFNFKVPKAKAITYTALTFSPFPCDYSYMLISQNNWVMNYVGTASYPTTAVKNFINGYITIGSSTVTFTNNADIKGVAGIGSTYPYPYVRIESTSGSLPSFAAGTYHMAVDLTMLTPNGNTGLYYTWNWEGAITINGSGKVTSTYNGGLAATISGPTSVDLVTAGTWTTNISGGVPPYTTAWQWGKFPPQWIGYQTSTSLTQVLAAGNWTIHALINDSIGTNIVASISVTAGAVAGSYTAHLTRSGALGNIIDIYVTDVTNTNVTISSTANTKLGYFTGDGVYHLDNAIAEAAQYITYTWRWTTQIAIPPDMWFFSSIHLAVPNIDLAITHHFLTFNDGAVIVFGPTGDPTEPIELPPAPGSELNPLVQMFYDMLVKLFKYLFKLDSTEFSKQISGGWLNFESPIPSITPSYIISLPKLAMVDGQPGTGLVEFLEISYIEPILLR